MNYKIEILNPAYLELDQIADYYARKFGTRSAEKVIMQIKNSIGNLQIFPHSGTATPDEELNKQNYRMIISGDFVIIHRLINDIIFIYHIANVQTDYAKLFKK